MTVASGATTLHVERVGFGEQAVDYQAAWDLQREVHAAVAAEQSAEVGHEVTAQQVALAWLSASGPTLVPIPGFTRTATADSSAAAADLVLSPDQRARLDASPAGPGSMYPDDED